ncbi:MAG: 4-(cytidine 5'-diphospho)-2-C-methyl-D-erythritol kinase [Pseudolabrys sp.]|nr:4-(cytidine 5'-diphospho)-2-C-methyl-D-erythritol kinase [Pseudolabrys sp.]
MPLSETAPAKINLTLRVIGRRSDGYHTLESLVAFADIADEVTLEPGEATSLVVEGAFAEPSGPTADNLVMKAADALAAQVGSLRTGRFQLQKNIPVAAGLGGGSSDAAAALRLLAVCNGLTLDDPRLLTAALAIGADVPVCLDPRAKVMRGVGEQLSPPVAIPKMAAVLINPGVAAATKDVFAAFDRRYASSVAIDEIPPGREPFIEWLAGMHNDLTEAAATRAPVIRQVLTALSAQIDCRLARMSGSGATCFALFDGGDEARYAAERLQAAHRSWWVRATTLN